MLLFLNLKEYKKEEGLQISSSEVRIFNVSTEHGKESG